MYFGAIQISGERISTSECREFCEALDAHKIKMLSLRECSISTKNFKKLMDSVGYCKSILHLNLNLCGIQNQNRLETLAAALNMNRSLTALLLHGNHFGTEGAVKVVRSLILHPLITCLDLGDCDLNEKALKYVCELFPPDGSKPGLQELVLSGNPKIPPKAWERFAVAIAASSKLRALYLDFNNIGETAGKMLIVAAAGHKTLNILDLEACDLTEEVGTVLLHLLQHYPTTLTHILLEENDISEETKYSIRLALGESASEDSSSDDEFNPKLSKAAPKETSKPAKQFIGRNSKVVKESLTPDGNAIVLKAKDQYLHGCGCQSDNTVESEETLAKFKIKLEEASETSDGEVLIDKDNLDVTYEFKADDVRFDFPSQSSFAHQKTQSDSGLEDQYQNHSSHTSDIVNLTCDSDSEYLTPLDRSPELSPRHASSKISQQINTDTGYVSDLEISRQKASQIFTRTRRVQN